MTDPVTAPEATNRTVGEPCVLLKLGEIFLKGKNRQQFVRMQQANVRAAVRSTGVPVELTVREGVLVLRVAHGEGQAAERMTAAEDAEAGLAAEGTRLGLGLEQFVGRDLLGTFRAQIFEGGLGDFVANLDGHSIVPLELWLGRRPLQGSAGSR